MRRSKLKLVEILAHLAKVSLEGYLVCVPHLDIFCPHKSGKNKICTKTFLNKTKSALIQQKGQSRQEKVCAKTLSPFLVGVVF